MTFEQAQTDIHKLASKPENDELLELYALYKQATEGDNTSPEPGTWDFVEKFKWNHWNSKKGMNPSAAQEAYATFVVKMVDKYGLKP